MKISTKLLFGFSTIALFVGIAGLVGFMGLKDVHDTAERIVNERFPLASVVDDLNYSFSIAQGLIRDYFLIDDERNLPEQKDQYHESQKEIENKIETIASACDKPDIPKEMKNLVDIISNSQNDLIKQADDLMDSQKKLLVVLKDRLVLFAKVRTQSKILEDISINEKIMRAQLLAGELILSEERALKDNGRNYLKMYQDTKQSLYALKNAFPENAITESSKRKIKEASASYLAILEEIKSNFDTEQRLRQNITNSWNIVKKQEKSQKENLNKLLEQVSRGQQLSLKQMSVILWQSAIGLVVLSLVSFLAAIGIGLLLSRQISKPLRTLVKYTSAVTAGNTYQQVDIHTKDELGVLASAFNRMSRAVLNREEELHNSAEYLKTLNEQLGSYSQKLEQTNKQLAQSNQKVSTAYSELEKVNRQVTAEKERSRVIVRGISDAIILTDSKQNVMDFNPKAAQMFQLSGDSIGKPILETINNNELLKATREALLQEKKIYTSEIALPDPYTGKNRIFSLHTSTATDEVGNKVGAVSVLRDVTGEKELEEIKTNFLQTVSHELRTPLTSIIGFLDLVVDESSGELNDVQKDFLTTARDSSLTLQKLINDLLDLSKIEAGKMELHKEPMHLKIIVDKVKQNLLPLCKNKNLYFENRIPDELPLIELDSGKLAQVFTNLAGNAIKFTDQGGITVSASESEDVVQVIVEDTGIGIPKDKLNKVFEKFSQVDNSSTRKYEGTGLGLPIVKSIIEMHNGHIWAESGQGQGTTFIFTLPKSGQSSAKSKNTIDIGQEEKRDAQKTETYNPPDMDIKKTNNTINGSSPLQKQTRGISQKNNNHNKKASNWLNIIVFDSNEIIEQYAEILAPKRLNVVSASIGNELFVGIRENNPILFIIDPAHKKEGESGLDILKRLKDNPTTLKTPVIIVTSIAPSTMGAIFEETDGYLRKPVDQNDLLELMDALTPNREKDCVAVLSSDAEIFALVRAYLESSEFIPVWFPSLEDTISAIRNNKIKALIIDLAMMEFNGLIHFAESEQIESLKDIPKLAFFVEEESSGGRIFETKIFFRSIGDIHCVVQSLEIFLQDIPFEAKNNKALIVDDDPEIANNLSHALEDIYIQSVVAKHSESAIRSLEEEAFDVVLVNLHIDNMDGFEVIKYLLDNNKLIKICILINRDMSVYDRQNLKSGMCQYICKDKFFGRDMITALEALSYKEEI